MNANASFNKLHKKVDGHIYLFWTVENFIDPAFQLERPHRLPEHRLPAAPSRLLSSRSPSCAPGRLWSSDKPGLRWVLELLPEDWFRKVIFFAADTCHPQHSGHTACPAPLQDNRNVRWSNMGRLKIRSHRGSNTGYITSFKVTTFEERPMLPGCPVNFFIRSRFIGPWKRYLCSTTL